MVVEVEVVVDQPVGGGIDDERGILIGRVRIIDGGRRGDAEDGQAVILDFAADRDAGGAEVPRIADPEPSPGVSVEGVLGGEDLDPVDAVDDDFVLQDLFVLVEHAVLVEVDPGVNETASGGRDRDRRAARVERVEEPEDRFGGNVVGVGSRFGEHAKGRTVDGEGADRDPVFVVDRFENDFGRVVGVQRQQDAAAGPVESRTDFVRETLQDDLGGVVIVQHDRNVTG